MSLSAHKDHAEKGAALIIVLGLVAVIAGWAATAGYEDMLSLRRAENAVVGMKAELACLSALALAKVALKQDARDGNVDSLDDDWAQVSAPFPIDDGLVLGEVIDANRYLNLNDLVDAKGQAVLPMVNVAKRLFAAKKLDTGLVDALVDWMDIDDVPFGLGGVENSGYYDKRYRVKNAPLDRVAELYLIKGFDKDVMDALKDVVTVWPLVKGAEYSKVNVNTAQESVLLAMFPNMSDVDKDDVMNNRSYDSVDMLKMALWAQGKEAQAMFSHLSVVSNHFMVRVHAVFGRADRQEEYGLSRDGEKITLLWRERLLWQP
ncbi:MAG: type II secretion system minor pseudopilin GspK [Mariprofundaceae bacterium]|nr:type II secretion system minor pseudopilin GspK [Mariprofundaceae bacterium]